MPAYGLEHNKQRLPKLAASAIGDHVAVRHSASQADYVLPAGSSNARVLGVALASAASPGDPVAVQTEGIAVMRAAASLGPDAQVIVASTNGRVGPLGAAPSAPIPQGLHIIGTSQSAAVDGDYFSVLINPRSA